MKPEEIRSRIRRLRLRSRKLIHTFGEGTFRTIFHGRGIEFAALREYVPGDDIRQIEWNTTARRGTPFVKTFMEERDLSILLLLDLSSSMDRKWESLCALTALISYMARANDDRLGAIGFSAGVDFFVPPSRHPTQPERILHLLLQQSGSRRKTSISRALLFLHRILKKHSILFLISDFLDVQFEKALYTVCHRHELVGVDLHHPIELKPLPGAVMDCFDPESGKRILLDGFDRKTRAQYTAFYENQRKQLARFFANSRSDLLTLKSGPDAELRLIQFLQMRQNTHVALQLAIP
jgi:uncharacterized protein (DUF58 family)